VIGVLGDRGHALVDESRGARERVLLPEHPGLAFVSHDRRELVAGRVDPGLDRAPPRVGDRRADVVGVLARIVVRVPERRDEPLPREPQLLGSDQRRLGDVDGQP